MDWPGFSQFHPVVHPWGREITSMHHHYHHPPSLASPISTGSSDALSGEMGRDFRRKLATPPPPLQTPRASDSASRVPLKRHGRIGWREGDIVVANRPQPGAVLAARRTSPGWPCFTHHQTFLSSLSHRHRHRSCCTHARPPVIGWTGVICPRGAREPVGLGSAVL